jgi:peptide/nickel transport system permease protein
VTLLGGEIAGLLNGIVLVESIFAWPGVGQVALQAIQRRDLPVLMASVFYVGVLVTVVNLLVDLAYAYLDPRVRLR